MVSVEVAVKGTLLWLGQVKAQAALGAGARLGALLLCLPALDDGPHAKRPLGASAHAISQAVRFDWPICVNRIWSDLDRLRWIS